MKKLVLLSSVLAGMLPISMMAQDDMYFTPKKSAKTVTSSSEQTIREAPTYYAGSDRDVDEYNRRGKFGSYFEKIGTDSLGNDIIEFHSSTEEITDTLAVYPGTRVDYYDVDDDYLYSRRMSRFDDFYWYDPWFYGPYYGWHSPWWYSRWGWYDPWYYGYTGWYGWYDPWYYGYYGWGYPYRHWYGGWYGGGHIARGGGVSGTRNHGFVTRRVDGGSYAQGMRSAGGHFGGGRTNVGTRNGNSNVYRRSTNTNGNYSFGGSRSTYGSSTTRSAGSSGSSFGGSSRGGGFSGGGGARSGGGHFGGGRR